MKSFTVGSGRKRGGAPEGEVALVIGGIEAFIPLGDLVDVEKERARLEKELAVFEGEIERAAKKLANPGFVNKAPQKVVDEEKQKLAGYEAARGKLKANLEKLKI